MKRLIGIVLVALLSGGCGFHEWMQQGLSQPSAETDLVARARYRRSTGPTDNLARMTAYNICVRADNSSWEALDGCMRQAGYEVK